MLQRVRRDGAYATLALSAELERERGISAADRALTTELVYGVLRRRRQLDFVLGQRMRQPLERVNIEVLDVLRIAAYQLLLLDRVPAYAAVDEAVSAVRRLRGPRVAGFANAVLRRLEKDGLDLTDLRHDDPLQNLGLQGSLPDALAAEWMAQLGVEEAGALALAMLEPASLTVRANLQRTTAEALAKRLEEEGAEVRASSLAPAALRVRSGGGETRWHPAQSEAYHDGLWTMQDEGAQLVSLLLAPAVGMRVLDACAGLGGKTTHLVELLAASGEAGPQVLAVDPQAQKLQLLDEHCRRLGLRCDSRLGTLQSLAAGELATKRFDAILVDAPCSGLGVLRRHPELRWRAATSRSELVALQRELLRSAVQLLADDGVLVYAVCTTSEEEGPQQCRWLRSTYPELELTPPNLSVAPSLAALAPQGELRLWPQRHDTDGFYAVRLRRAQGRR